jgi:hypothetical protein
MPITQNIKTQMNAPGEAPMFACRAWVNFDGRGTTGTNQTIRGSGNVASVFKNGTGDYTINFKYQMPDQNYSIASICGQPDQVASIADNGVHALIFGVPQNNSVRVRIGWSNAGNQIATDCGWNCFSFFR